MNISRVAACNVLEAHFYVAISKCKSKRQWI